MLYIIGHNSGPIGRPEGLSCSAAYRLWTIVGPLAQYFSVRPLANSISTSVVWAMPRRRMLGQPRLVARTPSRIRSAPPPYRGRLMMSGSSLIGRLPDRNSAMNGDRKKRAIGGTRRFMKRSCPHRNGKQTIRSTEVGRDSAGQLSTPGSQSTPLAQNRGYQLPRSLVGDFETTVGYRPSRRGPCAARPLEFVRRRRCSTPVFDLSSKPPFSRYLLSALTLVESPTPPHTLRARPEPTGCVCGLPSL